MPLKERQAIMAAIEELRGGRRLVCLCNFDRVESPTLNALCTQYQEDIKEPLFRVLKETIKRGNKLDVFLYTRGGALNAVWPIASLLREFDGDFEVLVPFRAHSSGTLLALSAKKILMAPLAELSPIDPTTANQFNPRDPVNQQATLGIAVEDLSAYEDFWRTVYGVPKDASTNEIEAITPHLKRLSENVHPLALGGAHRVAMQIRDLAKLVMEKHYSNTKAVEKIVDQLATRYFSHHHMINRREARKILGGEHVELANSTLSRLLDKLLKKFEDDFKLRYPFFLTRYMGDDVEKEPRFIGGSIESRHWAYLFETRMKIRQYMNPPQGIQIQIEPGIAPPLVPGVPRRLELQTYSQGWVRNTEPLGMTS